MDSSQKDKLIENISYSVRDASPEDSSASASSYSSKPSDTSYNNTSTGTYNFSFGNSYGFIRTFEIFPKHSEPLQNIFKTAVPTLVDSFSTLALTLLLSAVAGLLPKNDDPKNNIKPPI